MACRWGRLGAGVMRHVILALPMVVCPCFVPHVGAYLQTIHTPREAAPARPQRFLSGRYRRPFFEGKFPALVHFNSKPLTTFPSAFFGSSVRNSIWCGTW